MHLQHNDEEEEEEEEIQEKCAFMHNMMRWKEIPPAKKHVLGSMTES
jgi:hypothetical protein